MERAKCLSVYADQNIYSQMLQPGVTDWRTGEMASTIIQAQRQGSAQIWVGPTNIIETLQATDVGRRRQLAAMMLELTENRRVWWGHEFEAISDFFCFLEAFAPDAIRHPAFFEHHATTMRQIWSGALALIAATGALHTTPLIEELRKLKAVNRLMHARFAADPHQWVDRMVEVVEKFQTTDANVFAEFDAMTLAEIEQTIGALENQIRRLDRDALAKLNKNRARISKAYGAVEVGRMLTAVFRLPMELQLVFDVPHIVERWPVLQKNVGCPPLPVEVRVAERVQLTADARLVQVVIQQAIFAAAHVGLMTTEIAHQAALLDLQKCINDRQLPTGGLTFDADHATAIKRFHVFICRDTNLAHSLKTIAHMVEDRSNGHWKPQIVCNPRQLADVIQNRGKILGQTS